MAAMTMQERLDRLERDLALLARVGLLPQRKVTLGEFERLQEISERFPERPEEATSPSAEPT